MTVRDTSGTETVVVLSDRTDFEPHGTTACDKICPGRCVKVEGRGNCCGQLVAEEVKFRKDDCNVCYFSDNIEALKAQTAQLSKNDEALAQQVHVIEGRVDENITTARTARAEAQAAQQAADAALAGARAANERISNLDDYKATEEAVVTFKTGSSVLSKEDKEILDQFAAKALASKGYIITISGFTDSTGAEAFNNRLSDWRADAAMRYLVSTANVPAQRVQITYAGGETMPVASNQTRHGRSQNRRAVIRLLISPAISNQTVTPTSTDH
jgi:outer membrane protein OmpA-like peptidoglycan-associated protein